MHDVCLVGTGLSIFFATASVVLSWRGLRYAQRARKKYLDAVAMLEERFILHK